MKNLARIMGYLPGYCAIITLALVAGSACRTAPTAQERTITLVYTSEVGGALDPCG